jgi:hypothetical protein
MADDIRWAASELDRKGERVLTWRVMRLAGLGEDVGDCVRAVLDPTRK